MSNSEQQNVFGSRVLLFRKKRQFTQLRLAELSGLSQAEICRIEKGRYRELNVDTIRQLAEAFEIEPDVLVRGTRFGSLFDSTTTLPDGPLYEGIPYTVYFASALTSLTGQQFAEIKLLDEQVQQICRDYGKHSLVLYRPRLETAP